MRKRSVPDFILIGAPKGGTTSLYHYLRQHPQVFMSTLKDSHFFLFDGKPPPLSAPSDQFRRREMVKSFADYQRQFSGGSEAKALGEVGVRYMDSPEACQRIRRRLPDAKLIIILRHPVDRAWSHYRMYRRNGSEPCETFEQALADEPRRLKEGWFRGVHRDLGFYYRHLLPYFEAFPRDQIRVYLYDDLRANAGGLMQDLFNFVGVDSDFRPDMATRFNEAGELANPVLRWVWSASRGLRSRVTPLVPVALRGHLVSWIARRAVTPAAKELLAEDTLLALLEDYRDDIEKLSGLIGRDLSHWLVSKS